MANTHFTVGIHILTLLANDQAAPLTSAFIARSVNSNPVFIRRLLAQLRQAKLVTGQTGPNGGWSIAKTPEGISLKDVFRAMEDGPLFPMHTATPNEKCPVGSKIQKLLQKPFRNAQLELEQSLERTTLHDLLKGVHHLNC